MITMDVKANSINNAYKDLCCTLIVDALEKGDYDFFASKWGAELVALCGDILEKDLDLDVLMDEALANQRYMVENTEDIFSIVGM